MALIDPDTETVVTEEKEATAIGTALVRISEEEEDPAFASTATKKGILPESVPNVKLSFTQPEDLAISSAEVTGEETIVDIEMTEIEIGREIGRETTTEIETETTETEREIEREKDTSDMAGDANTAKTPIEVGTSAEENGQTLALNLTDDELDIELSVRPPLLISFKP